MSFPASTLYLSLAGGAPALVPPPLTWRRSGTLGLSAWRGEGGRRALTCCFLPIFLYLLLCSLPLPLCHLWEAASVRNCLRLFFLSVRRLRVSLLYSCTLLPLLLFSNITVSCWCLAVATLGGLPGGMLLRRGRRTCGAAVSFSIITTFLFGTTTESPYNFVRRVPDDIVDINTFERLRDSWP